MRLMMAMGFRMRLVLGLVLSLVCFIEPSADAATNALVTGQELSRQADALIKGGDEQKAAQLYLAAHVQFQSIILAYFESALRESLGGQPAERDEEALMRAGSQVGDLRNVNLSKLWIVLDPEVTNRAWKRSAPRSCNNSINLLMPNRPIHWKPFSTVCIRRMNPVNIKWKSCGMGRCRHPSDGNVSSVHFRLTRLLPVS
jgi:hypothetical protein